MFSRAIIRPPGTNYAEGLTRVPLGTPAYERARQQHTAYCEALERCGLELIQLEAEERYPDSTFVEDTAVLIPAGAILTRPGAASRIGEVESIRETLSGLCPRIDSIQDPGTVDGGDVCEAGNHFFIGLSDRTNEAGTRQLAELLASYGYTSSIVDIRKARRQIEQALRVFEKVLRFFRCPLWHCKVPLCYCRVALWHCRVPLRHCRVRLRLCKVPLRDCRVPLRHCRVRLRLCKVPLRE